MFPTASFEVGDYQITFSNLSNGLCMSNLTEVFDYTIIAHPDLSVNQNEVTVCEGETVTFELTATGGMTNNPQFKVLGTGIETIEMSGLSYTIELTPTESMDINLNQIIALDPECETYCASDIDLNLHVEVMPMVEVPEINGEVEIDARITPRSTYEITNNVMVGFELEPSDAGTLLPANDGKTVVVTWNQSYKGRVVLTAIPTADCNQGENSIEIQVKNSTELSENGKEPRIYPNPASEKITIQGEGMTRVSIYSTLGQLMYDAQVNNLEASVEVGQYPAGTYIVKVTCGEKTHTQLVNIVK